MHPGMKQSLQNEGAQALAAAGWSATSFRIRTADGWLEVGGIVRLPFGIDQRATGETCQNGADQAVSGGGVRHQQNSLSGEQELAFVEVDPVQAFPGMASSRRWSRDIRGAGVRCAAQLNRAGAC